MSGVIFECTVDQTKLNVLVDHFTDQNEGAFSYVESISELTIQEGIVPFSETHQLVRYFSKQEELIIRPLKTGLMKVVVTTDEPSRWKEEAQHGITLEDNRQTRAYYLEQATGQPYVQAKICRYDSEIGEVYRWMEVLK